MTDEIIKSLVEVKLVEPESFLKIKETLQRIGIASKKTNTLYQSCHILHKKGKYYIVHFKDLFALDGKKTDISEEDIARRNTIATLLEQWGLLTIVNPDDLVVKAPMNQVKVISFKDKENWTLVEKYQVGRKINSV